MKSLGGWLRECFKDIGDASGGPKSDVHEMGRRKAAAQKRQLSLPTSAILG